LSEKPTAEGFVRMVLRRGLAAKAGTEDEKGFIDESPRFIL